MQIKYITHNIVQKGKIEMQEIVKDRLRVNIEDINRKNSENIYKFVGDGEDAFKNQIEEIASQIEEQNKKIIFITGPSSAGKTTTSSKICDALKRRNLSSFVLNMDDFFRDLDTVPLLEDGKPDMEGIVALDTDCIRKSLNEILIFGKTMLPQFDFATHKRKKEWIECMVDKNQIVILEGIHALNPKVTDGIDQNKTYKVYVHCNTDFYYNGKILLQAKDLRLLRRIERDERERQAPIEETLSLWDAVCAGEDKNIRPYKHTANYLLNSTHFYEPLLYKWLLLKKFEKLDTNNVIREFLEKFRLLSVVDVKFVPEDSLIREFIGYNEGNER